MTKPSWEGRLLQTFGEFEETAPGEFQLINAGELDSIKSFIAKEIEEAREEGKAYWEPSEHHKGVWRKEGRQAERQRILERVRGMQTNTSEEATNREVEVPKYGKFRETLAHLTGYNQALDEVIKLLTDNE